ncbi:hypothetical protein [Streptomyces sp. Ncost-T10-10d]|uniref:hypothetical protein n=1 Tax=Streptomyces sp. Ncost-T10-10d TaxID=1839774 RepID=UPI00352036EE
MALFVATTWFAPDARAIAETYGITLVDRAHLEKWSVGVPLPTLRLPSPGREWARSRKDWLRLRAFAILERLSSSKELSHG